MRYGFTTGSCAAAAAKAAAYMLFTGREKTEITIVTPKGIPYTAELLDIRKEAAFVSCAVEKDGGDDPDITTGALIYAKVSYGKDTGQDAGMTERIPEENGSSRIYIEGGAGVGRVTKPGLNQPVGNAAINRVPREMITKEVLEVCELVDYRGELLVEISVPDGEQLAARTFNPRLGITGGISILGTSGIVEPMSSQALLETIRLELSQRRSEGYAYAAVAPGNYGIDFMKSAYGYDLDRSIKCSNYIGQTIDMAAELGYERLLLTGHIGKLIKVAGGIMNTHSAEGDCRLELLAAFSIKKGVEAATVQKILSCVTTEEAVALLKAAEKLAPVMDYAMERICYYLEKRAKGKLEIDCMMYASEFGSLAESRGAKEWFTLLAREQERRI